MNCFVDNVQRSSNFFISLFVTSWPEIERTKHSSELQFLPCMLRFHSKTGLAYEREAIWTSFRGLL